MSSYKNTFSGGEVCVWSHLYENSGTTHWGLIYLTKVSENCSGRGSHGGRSIVYVNYIGCISGGGGNYGDGEQLQWPLPTIKDGAHKYIAS